MVWQVRKITTNFPTLLPSTKSSRDLEGSLTVRDIDNIDSCFLAAVLVSCEAADRNNGVSSFLNRKQNGGDIGVKRRRFGEKYSHFHSQNAIEI